MKKVIKLVAFIVYIVFAMNFLVQGQAVTQPERRYHVIDLGTLGDSGSSAVAINNKGEVVGYYGTISGNVRSFLYSKCSIRDIGTFCCGSADTVVLGLNDKSEIVGYGRHPFNGSITAFLYTGESMQYVGTLEGLYSQAAGINNQGEIVGKFIPSGSQYTRSFLSQSGTIKDLGTFGGVTSEANAINNNGQIVGFAALNSREYHAFLYENGSMRDLGTLGGNFSTANALNNHGQVVGRSQLPNNGFMHAFLYSEGEIKDLGTLGGNHSNASGINDNGEIVGDAHPSGSTIVRAFLYSNGSMKDLNDLLIVTNSGWVISFANAINNNGQIVGWGTSPFGQQRAVLLNPVSMGEIETILDTQLAKLVFGNYPVKESGKDSLVVITHGWQLKLAFGLPRPDVSWIDDMSNSVTSYLLSSGSTNWQVYGYKWLTNAWKVASNDALLNARQEGMNLGSALSVQGWKHVHLIGHSAGSRLIQEASEWIKSVSPTTTVHCTFLDPDVGNDKEGIKHYGSGTDWSDNYFVRDSITSSRTEGCLSNAYNVDVKLLDPSVKVTGVSRFISSDGEPNFVCHTAGTSHQWPRYFYTNTIVGKTNLEYKGFGFPLSKEGVNWDYALANYPTGNVPAHILGTIECDIEPPVTPIIWPNQPVDFTQGYIFQGPSGSVQKWIGSVKMDPGSPVWIGNLITLTNPANSVSFDLVFSGTTNSDSLFSVYWDTNVVGTIVEKYVRPGLQHYSLSFPQAMANNSYILGFRLDPYTNALSSVTLTNIVVSQIGVSEPFSLSFTGTTTNGVRIQELTGESGFEYYVQSSTNLLDWVDFAVLVNTNGTVRFYDQSLTNGQTKFYRAIAP